MTPFSIRHLGLLPYRDAWAIQEQTHAAVATGSAPPTLLVVEHPPVITFGRRSELSASHLLASQDLLRQRGVEVVESDRGGDITFHGPGQVVVYPIIRLIDFKLSVGAYVKRLEAAAIATCAAFGIHAGLDPNAIGVWTRPSPNSPDHPPAPPAKICAIGVRVTGGATLHGLAFNHSTDLSFFNLIVPCGIADKGVTSLQKLLGDRAPTLDTLRQRLASDVCTEIARPTTPQLAAI
jgi:lipoyl(octanoyl) transferase